MARRDDDSEDESAPGAHGRRRQVAIAVAAGVGLATARFYSNLDSPPTAGASPLDGLVYYLVVGPIVGVLFYYVIAATLARTALWVAACGLGGYVFVAWFAWPVVYQHTAALAADAGTAARRSGAAEREEWVRALLASGRYGRPGETPPMLEVHTGDTGAVRVRNTGVAEAVVSLAIVAADGEASGGWRGCGFSGYAGEGAQEWVTLGPSESAIFELEPLCKEIFFDRESFTEIRVGKESVAVENGWWTTSAFAAPHGRSNERASGNTALPSSYDAHAFYGSED